MGSERDVSATGPMERVRPKKGLGQNFLIDRNVLSRIVAAAGVVSGDHVLEIGPGRGALTGAMAATGARILAIELDRRLVPVLEERFGGSANVEVLQGDILATDLANALGCRYNGSWKVVANLPYNISSQVLIKLIDDRRLFSLMVLMLQREVGERLVAPPGSKEYGVLTLFCRLHFDVKREIVVKPGSFRPVPKVDSVVLSLRTLPAPRVDVGDELFFREVVKASFAQRRKTLWNCLRSASFVADEGRLREVLQLCGIDGGRRGETLTLEEFALLCRSLKGFRSSSTGEEGAALN